MAGGVLCVLLFESRSQEKRQTQTPHVTEDNFQPATSASSSLAPRLNVSPSIPSNAMSEI